MKNLKRSDHANVSHLELTEKSVCVYMYINQTFHKIQPTNVTVGQSAVTNVCVCVCSYPGCE